MTITEIRDALTQLIDAGLGEELLIDIDNRTKSTEYFVDGVQYNEKLNIITVNFDSVEREEVE